MTGCFLRYFKKCKFVYSPAKPGQAGLVRSKDLPSLFKLFIYLNY